MHLLHLNVHSWVGSTSQSNAMAVRELIREQQPDVVSLVEVDERWGPPEVLSSVADDLGYRWYFAPAFTYGEQESAEGSFGNAILARSSLLACTSVQLSWPARLYDSTEPSEARVLALAHLRVADGTELWFGSTHMPKSDAEARSQALERLLGLVPHLGSQWAVCGDFNAPPSSLSLPDEVRAVPDAIPSYPAERPVEELDYCLLPAGLAATGRMLPLSVSDHLPLSVTF